MTTFLGESSADRHMETSRSTTCCHKKRLLKDKFSIFHLKPCFKIVSDEIERLRLKFGHVLLAREQVLS